MRTSLTRLVIATLATAAVAGLATPAAIAAVAIPKKVGGTASFATLTVKRGKQVEVVPKSNKAGKAFLKRLRAGAVDVNCYGVDAANTSLYYQMGTLPKLARGAAKLKFKFTIPVALYGCVIGPKNQQITLQLVGDLKYQTEITMLDETLAKELDAEGKLIDSKVRNPTPTQIIEQMIASGFTQPPTLVALTRAGEYPATGSLGVWSDPRVARINTTHVDGAQLAAVWTGGVLKG